MSGLELREVRGPSALGGGRRRAWRPPLPDRGHRVPPLVPRHRARLPVVADAPADALRGAARRVHAGVRPRRPREELPVLLLFGIVLFSFFQEATTQAVPSIVNQESVVRKTQFPRLVIPLSVVLTALFNLGVNLVVVLGFLLASGVDPHWSWLGLPLILAALLALTTAVATIARRALPALPRHRDHLGRRGDHAVLRDAGALPDRHRAGAGCAMCSRSTRWRRCSSWRASGWSTRPRRARCR